MTKLMVGDRVYLIGGVAVTDLGTVCAVGDEQSEVEWDVVQEGGQRKTFHSNVSLKIAKSDKVNYVKRYNELVEEAIKVGLTMYKPIKSHFRDAATGAKRCDALEKAIRSKSDGETEAAGPKPQSEAQAAEQPSATEESEVSKTRTKTKTKAAPKAAKGKARANGKDTRTSAIYKDFGPHVMAGSYREALLDLLYSSKGKKVDISDAFKEVYKGESKKEKFGAFTTVLRGLATTAGKVGWKITKEGRGEEATVCLTEK